MERDKEIRREQEGAQEQPADLSSFNNRNPAKSTEAEDVQESNNSSDSKIDKPAPGDTGGT